MKTNLFILTLAVTFCLQLTANKRLADATLSPEEIISNIKSESISDTVLTSNIAATTEKLISLSKQASWTHEYFETREYLRTLFELERCRKEKLTK